MLIVSDSGGEIINADNVFSFSIGMVAPKPGAPPVDALVAQGGQWTAVLAMGMRERCEKGLDAIRKGVKERWHLLDLRDVPGVGQRPNPDIVIPRLVGPPNGGQPR
jgi:hypothetical protein